MTGHRCLGLIPARGGSKRIPGKNVKPLAGKPLIVHTIEAALSSRSLWKVVVSTDDPGIAELSKAAGADVPFMRPKHLADDSASSLDVIRHALEFFESDDETPTEVMLLQPTSPLRSASDIDAATAIFRESGADTLVSVKASTVKMGTLVPGFLEAGKLMLREPPHRDGEMHQLNGAIYIARVGTIAEKGSIFGDSIVGYPMPAERSVDIDTEDDWRLAEMLLGGASD